MAISKKLENYLSKNNILHDIVTHRKVYTAFDLAQTTGKKLSDIAKTIAIKADTRYALIIIPASHKLDLPSLKKRLGAKKVSIVKEVYLAKVLKVKPGSITPFSTFHNIPVYLDKSILKSRVILVSTGSHTDSLKIKTKILLDKGAETLTTVSKKHFNDTVQKSKKAIRKIKSKTREKINKGGKVRGRKR